MNTRSVALERPAQRPSLRDRLAARFERIESGPVVEGTSDEAWDPVMPRFPITRQGYDCAAVDEYVDDLEQELHHLDRELAEIRAGAPSRNEVSAEIERIGRETSSILLAAHDKAQETMRLAQEQADRCIADAASQAIATTAKANDDLRRLEAEQANVRREHEKLLGEIQGLADSLSALARREPDQ